MIASVRGTIVARDPALVVEVGGLGLALHVSARTAVRLPAIGEAVRLHTYLHVREDTLALYGFAAEEERALFLNLLAVNGVGPRAALTLLSSATVEDLVRALEAGDETWLVRLPGVGKKTAQRLIVEMQGKLPSRGAATVERSDDARLDEAMLALVSLGLTSRAAKEAVDKAQARGLDAGAGVEDVVKAALQAGARNV
jgi:Holliday junction DNA helicase RuvA